jgi:hypothetical protein
MMLKLWQMREQGRIHIYVEEEKTMPYLSSVPTEVDTSQLLSAEGNGQSSVCLLFVCFIKGNSMIPSSSKIIFSNNIM